ncbi:MAG: 50S ribosomal protein L32e [Candidatus Altiarchaeota archaeon]|nr:50S ribosomal protein L32e [Candidatus Altiarchaeota archaeon]
MQARPAKEKTALAKKEEKKKEKPPYTLDRSVEAKKLAKARSRLKKKKGNFKRQNLGKKKKVPDRWRRPKGIDSRHQDAEKCKPPLPRAGYKTPYEVRGLHPSGYLPVRVWNTSDLSSLDPKSQAIIIASSVGRKKRDEIQNLAKGKSIQVLNFK